jgi:hypothetical protein
MSLGLHGEERQQSSIGLTLMGQQHSLSPTAAP